MGRFQALPVCQEGVPRVAIRTGHGKKTNLVLADEPTANLDAANSHHILQSMDAEP
jgi:ABC-type lipoprotein export system ATPase subunit